MLLELVRIYLFFKISQGDFNMIYYYFTAILSCVLSIIYFSNKGKFSGLPISLLYVVIPLSNIGNLWLAHATCLEEALLCNNLIYIGACMANPLMVFIIMDMCKIKYKKIFPQVLFIVNGLIMALEFSNRNHNLFYTSISFVKSENNIGYLVKDYGPVHTLFYITFVLYIIIDVIVIIYGIKNKKDASIRTMVLLAIMVFLSIMAFFVGRLISVEYELTPLSYINFQIVLLIIEARGMLYNFDETISDSLIQKSGIGYMAIDKRKHYLGSNAISKEWFPILSELKLDQSIDTGEEWLDYISSLIDQVQNTNNTIEIIRTTNDDKSIKIKADFFIYNKKNLGYIIWLEDVTIEQAYINKVLFEKEHDFMTGLYNKGKYLELIKGHYKYLNSISIFNMDVNNLKKLNDTYGHEKGDELIIKAAQSLLSVQKENIKGFRLGGDEFLLIGENMSMKETEQLKKDWEEAVNKLNKEGLDFEIVISCGVAYGEKDYDLEKLLSEADSKMYENKQYLKSLKAS